MAKDSVTARVSTLPSCDFCPKTAAYDGRTKMGPWAFMCPNHFVDYGTGVGLGKGQRLVVHG